MNYRWNIIRHAARGRSHEKNGLPCQDKTFALQQQGVCVTALADGAGSAALSHHGAACVVEYLCADVAAHFHEYMQTHEAEELRRILLSKLQARLTALAAELDCSLQALASTLLLVASDGETCLVVHIGDGVIGMRRAGHLHVISHPSNGEFSNTTTFTISPHAVTDMRVLRGDMEGVEGFILMSDGTETSLYHKRSRTLAPWLDRIFRLSAFVPPERLQTQVVRSVEQVFRRRSADDCSLVLMMHEGEGLRCFRTLSTKQKARLLGMREDEAVTPRRVRYAERLLLLLCTPQKLEDVARRSRLPAKRVFGKLRKLVKAGAVSLADGLYRTRV